MQTESLKRRLGSLTDLDVERRWAEFTRETGSQDPDRFLMWLRERWLLDTAVFVELSASDPITTARLVGVTPQRTLVLAEPDAPTLASPPSGTSESAPVPPPPAPDGGHSRLALLGLLGKGAMGEVLVARDVELRRKVAFKRMVPEVAGDRRLASRFFEEVQVTAQLDHPNIVPIYGLEVGAGGQLGYSMKLVQGRTLTDLLDEAIKAAPERKPREEAERLARHLDLFLRVCDGIAYAHSKGVLHRDLKPDNIMVGRYNEVYVMDWGICRVMGTKDADADNLVTIGPVPGAAPEADAEGDAAGKRTQYGSVLGTPAYMSPEQALGKNPELDGRSDLYTLGLILQEVATLRRAVSGPSLVTLLMRAAQAQRDPVEHINPRVDVPRELVAIIARATALRPDDRYPSVAAFADDLRRHLRGESVEAEPDNAIQALMRWMARHKTATATAMLVLLLAGAAAAIGLLLHGQRRLARAAHHERQLEMLLARVSQQSHAIDDHLHTYEAELRGLAGRAVGALADDRMPSHRFYLTTDFDRGAGPPDTMKSTYYALSISVHTPALQLAPKVDDTAITRQMRALASLGPAFREMLLASHGEAHETLDDAHETAMIATEGVPMLRAFVTLAEGVHATYPGMGGFPPDYDGRERPKYKLGEGKHGIQWGNPYRDRYGHGLLLPSAMALYDDDGRFLGVAGFDMTFHFIMDRLIGMPDAPAVEETMLVDDQGLVVVHAVRGRKNHRGELLGDARDRVAQVLSAMGEDEVRLDPLRFPDVVEAIRAKRTGHIETKGPRKVVAYFPLSALGWYYVVVADGDKLFAWTDPKRPEL